MPELRLTIFYSEKKHAVGSTIRLRGKKKSHFNSTVLEEDELAMRVTVS